MIVGKSSSIQLAAVQDRMMLSMEEQSSRPKVIHSPAGMSQGKWAEAPACPGGSGGPRRFLTKLKERGTWAEAEQMKDGCPGSEPWTFYQKAGPEKAGSLGR